MDMEITVNGEKKQVAADTSLTELIVALGLNPKAMAALQNDKVVERARFDATALREGDLIELVHFVPGG